MKNKPVEMTVLFDFYGAMLTDKQREFFDLYYNDDLSLSEIAENQGITRQGVRDAIHRAELTLSDFEKKLGLYKKYGSIESGLIKIQELAGEIKQINSANFLSGAIDDKIREVIECIRDIQEDN